MEASSCAASFLPSSFLIPGASIQASISLPPPASKHPSFLPSSTLPSHAQILLRYSIATICPFQWLPHLSFICTSERKRESKRQTIRAAANSRMWNWTRGGQRGKLPAFHHSKVTQNRTKAFLLYLQNSGLAFLATRGGCICLFMAATEAARDQV